MNKELLSRDRDADTRPEGRHWPAAEILCAERFPLFLASIGPRVCHEARRMCARFEAESTISGGYRLDAPGAAPDSSFSVLLLLIECCRLPAIQFVTLRSNGLAGSWPLGPVLQSFLGPVLQRLSILA